MNYTLKQIATIIQGKLISKNIDFNEQIINQLVFDSRKLRNSQDCLFFAVKGKSRDGHQFIKDAFSKGVRCFVVEDEKFIVDFKDKAAFIICNNSIEALQNLAAYHRKQFDIPLIAVTGSNGKTIVKEWVYQLLSHFKKVYRSPKSFNSQIGVPLSVWGLEAVFETAIFEAGISKPFEMEKLEKIIQPEIGILTNIAEAHQENFKNIEEKIFEKLKLFRNCRVLIYNNDDTLLDAKIRQLKDEKYFKAKGFRLFSRGKNENADLKLISYNTGINQTELNLKFENKKFNLNIPFTDLASVENVMSCMALMLVEGYNFNEIKTGIQTLEPVAMRLEYKEGINGSVIINDTYNSDLVSLRVALDFLKHQAMNRTTKVILSDIIQSGKKDEDLYAEVGKLLKLYEIDKLIGIGTKINKYRNLMPSKIDQNYYPDTESFISGIHKNNFENEAILIKGARKFTFENITAQLVQKVHETLLEINLASIIENLNFYRSLIKKDTKIMAMVKAFSYGGGSYEIARILQFHGVNYLGVAYADEGLALRENGIEIPVMVMSPEISAFDKIIKFKLEPEIYSFRILESFLKTLERYPEKHPYPVHIKLDTGMHRLGFCNDDMNKLLDIIINVKSIEVKSVFSHLAVSESNEEKEFSVQQINSFSEMSELIQKKLGYRLIKHILNTAGIINFPEHSFDMVRLGLGLYGIDTTNKVKNHLSHVSTLKTSVLQIKELQKGDSVGYGRSGKISGSTKIATIGIGYADGFNMQLGNGNGKVLINGKLAKVIGNVCMDMCMIDVSGLNVNEGDEVIIFNEKLKVTDLAVQLNTISYEILSGISQRVKRVYVMD